MGRFGGLDPPSWLSPIMRGTLCEMKRHPFFQFSGAAAGLCVAAGMLWSQNAGNQPTAGNPPSAPLPAQSMSATELAAIPIVPPRTGKSVKKAIFDGRTLNGWDGNSELWSVDRGEIVGRSTGRAASTFLFTKDNYTDFRLTFSSKMVDSENHAGIGFWGTVVPDAGNPTNKWAIRGPLIAFPVPAMWDYILDKFLRVLYKTNQTVTSQNEWNKVEILARGNRVRCAFNGVETMEWREADPSRIVAGPIGIQLHGWNGSQEARYKDIVVETFPKEDKLLTVKR